MQRLAPLPEQQHTATALKSCKVQLVQKLDEEDFHDRVEMCQTSVPMLETRKVFLPMKIVSIYMGQSINITLDMGVKPIHVLVLNRL